MTSARKIEVLRQIQHLIGRGGLLLARDAGLTEKELIELANEELIEASHFEDKGQTLDIHHIDKILPKGDLLLFQADLAPAEPLKVVLVTPPKSVWRRIVEAMGNKLLALIMNALSAAIGAVIGWYLKKHFP